MEGRGYSGMDLMGHFQCNAQGHQEFTPESVIKNQTKSHQWNYSFLHSHFLRFSQTKYSEPLNIIEKYVELWRTPTLDHVGLLKWHSSQTQTCEKTAVLFEMNSVNDFL